MASVFKPKGSKKYVILYTDDQGRRRKKVGATDKGVTQRIARDLENRVLLRREGLIDPRADGYATHETKPLTEHLDAFQRALEGKGGSAKHPKTTRNRAERVLSLAKARRISDLSLSKMVDALAAIRAEGLGAETINHHVRAVKAFSRWLWRDGRARDHALAHLATASSEGDRRHKRRALGPEEAAQVVESAAKGGTVKGLSGPDRARCYLLAMGTGLRASELASLTPERFDLASDQPTATVPAAYTKNGREAVQPIPPVLARSLAPWLATLPEGRPVFPLPNRTAEMLRVDLKAAGIPYETSAGVADFHSLRGVYISNLVASGASVKTCQVLARHSTPSLTIGLYAKASLHDLAGAVASLPDLAPVDPGHGSQAMAATGTNGPRVRGATGNATILPGSATEPVTPQGGSVILSMDLKSSEG